MFSADQMDVRGGGNDFIQGDRILECVKLLMYSPWMVWKKCDVFLCFKADEDAEWQISQSPTSVIGHSTGDEGLAQPMLEVIKTSAFNLFLFNKITKLAGLIDFCIHPVAPNQWSEVWGCRRDGSWKWDQGSLDCSQLYL